jgi:hypothetical protein
MPALDTTQPLQRATQGRPLPSVLNTERLASEQLLVASVTLPRTGYARWAKDLGNVYVFSSEVSLASNLAVAFGATIVTACVHVEHPPASWGNITPATTSDDCVSFRATYSNRGKKPDGSLVLLATWLYPKNAPTRGIDKDLIGAQTVTLELDNALLTVTMNGPGGAFHRWSFDKSKREIACRNGVLSVSQGGDLSGQNIAAVGT